ncbi:MAG: hypothetical protein KatS3mg107_1050 [Gemmataceae bacterium]|nr:MAG: hypothetical protein KatS3mg107_1050 [Gemmataceae bacterium]
MEQKHKSNCLNFFILPHFVYRFPRVYDSVDMNISAVTLDCAPNRRGICIIRIPAIQDVVFLFCQFFDTTPYRFPQGGVHLFPYPVRITEVLKREVGKGSRCG